MALPDIIEIIPLQSPVSAQITVPGSKSITNRALILAALAEGTVTLEGALWSEDTQVMTDCLRTLGFQIDVSANSDEPCNRTITVTGQAGSIPAGGTPEEPAELFVGNAGTAARFLTALVCLGEGSYRLSGIPRMHERPQAALVHSLRQLGYQVDTPNDRLPVVIHSVGAKTASCTVDINESSQFASALLLCAQAGNWSVQIAGSNSANSPYVEMTKALIDAFPSTGGQFQIEPDASGGSYFWGASWLQDRAIPSGEEHAISVNHWPNSGWQIDARFSEIVLRKEPSLPELSREEDLGDAIMTAITLAPHSQSPVTFRDLGRLRLQECERVTALRTELTRCAVPVTEDGDTLTVFPSGESIHGAEIETYDDHRMAMCFAVLGLKTSGIKIKNPSCVKKTFPNYFQKLAAQSPHGLGVEIRDARSGKTLSGTDLFAD
jgi:3-phosphoshikimate 1-carboxyvinyltransferase